MSVRDEQLLRPTWPFTLNHSSVQADGLIGWYPMIQGGGATVYDLTGRGSNLALNAGGWGESPISGGSLNLTGASTDYASLGKGLVTVEPVTLTGWYWSRTTTGVQTIASLSMTSAAANQMFRLILYLSKVQAQTQDASSSSLAASAVNFSTYTWQHAVAVFASGTLRAAYMNGANKGTNTTSRSTPVIEQMNIGRWRVAAPEPFNGQLADIRIYNRALSDAEIWALYDPSTRYELYYPLGRRLWFIPAGAPVTPLSVSGSITPVGALIKQGNKALSGSASPAGAITRQANKGASGSIAPSGSIAGLFAQAMAGLITPTGALAKLAGKLIAGSITPTGALSTLKVALLSLAGSLGLSGTITRRASKGLSGTITAAGGLAKRLAKALSSAITAVGALVSSLSGTNERITVTLSDEAVTIASVSDDLGG